MANINNMEMAQVLSTNPNISISKGFLGFGSKAVYTPTGSRLLGSINYYDADNGDKLVRLIDGPEADIVAKTQNMEQLKKLNIGNYRIETCISDDRQFAAIHIMRYSDFRHNPIREVKIYEGAAAQAIASIL